MRTRDEHIAVARSTFHVKHNKQSNMDKMVHKQEATK